ncbi:uncharacterized protein OCT59_017050 [Rhizophagus irregularis]|uniref:uncharacterized protein n=1 Tax=Rhizophagus irregularis TaxID=588596 RepID=UPI001A03548F|nr:hypothetical protein OCT59_017050 [Rhizophagus irregularis]GET52836.1 hypothetical protein GLOIN_2v1788993 [Rhizophagus irregularis DAOM 181602=DAOM 197198]
MNGKEFSNYPNDLNITWKDNKRTFHYKIMKAAFGNNFSNQVVSSKSSSDVTTLFHKQVNPESNIRTSGVIFFGLHWNLIGDEDVAVKKYKSEAMMMAIDNGQISRDAYRDLTTIEEELPREWIIAEK